MAITFLCGFEMGSTGEAYSVSGTTSVQSSVKRSGSYALRCNPTASASGSVTFRIRAAGGSFTSFSQSCRFYLRIGTLPSVDATFFQLNSGAQLKTTGAIAIGASVSSNTLSADGLWHLIEYYSTGGTIYVDVDGVNWVSAAGTLVLAASARFGFETGGTAVTADVYFDDICVCDTETLAYRGNSAQLCLLPTADPGALNGWTNSGGVTTSIFEGVNNRPPTGVAAATNGVKIKNAASGSNLDYVATMQTYTAAGVPSGATINAVMAVCGDGEEVTTGIKAGAVWIASNPAQTTGSGDFDYGNDTATVVGTYPTGWTTHFGTVSVAPPSPPALPQQ